jgi:hypothetical protein
LNAWVNIHCTIAAACHGKAQNIQLQILELELSTVQLVRKARRAEPVYWTLLFVVALVAVQACKNSYF